MIRRRRGGLNERRDPLVSSGRAELVGWILVGAIVVAVLVFHFVR